MENQNIILSYMTCMRFEKQTSKLAALQKIEGTLLQR